MFVNFSSKEFMADLHEQKNQKRMFLLSISCRLLASSGLSSIRCSPFMRRDLSKSPLMNLRTSLMRKHVIILGT